MWTVSSLDVLKASRPVCKVFSKNATVVPVPKISPACTPDSYRPVSVLTVLSKFLECYMYGIITIHLQTFHPLAESQWRFLPRKSTVTGLLTTTHNWFSILQGGGEIGAVFFELRKAVDSIRHEVLLE